METIKEVCKTMLGFIYITFAFIFITASFKGFAEFTTMQFLFCLVCGILFAIPGVKIIKEDIVDIIDEYEEL